MVDVAVFIAGIAVGLTTHGILSKKIYQQPWTVCENCKCRKQYESEHLITCPPPPHKESHPN